MSNPDSLRLGSYPSPLGELVFLTNSLNQVCQLGWSREHRRMEVLLGKHERLTRAAQPDIESALDDYFQGRLDALSAIAVAPMGTPFQQSVWSELQLIPAAETRSYGEVARGIGKSKAVRAVGLASGANPVVLRIPCHRVVGANGAITGFGAGIERKRWLLAHESAVGCRQLGLKL